jgi:hypothetical protein
MRFMVIVKATARSESGTLPSMESLARMDAFNEELAASGMLATGAGLQPSSTGKRITYGAPKPLVTDGPFAETKELIAGFCILEAPSQDDVVALLSRAPFDDGDQVEVRQIFEPADFERSVIAEDAQHRNEVAP